ncbi:SET domain-containing protein [Lophium mytilinum]|uniref:SET domain-containing protein n=1 Tax=Lophium mytilinum TaxID=390894 RepID=A0A6A6QTN3_9PEZI|nr:SET domain-containing protein [Lophium mytilinum]
MIYEIRQAGAKGLGLFATNPIARGTRILSERPLLAIRQDQDVDGIFYAAKSLTKNDKKALLDLSGHSGGQHLELVRWMQVVWWNVKNLVGSVRQPSTITSSIPSIRSMQEHMAIFNVFRSNSFNLGGRGRIQQAVFDNVARINHSCLPNAQGNFHSTLGRFNVHALRDIKSGEEVTLNYLPELGAVAASRGSKLRKGYGFECDCVACDLTSARGKLGEERRAEERKRIKEFAATVEKNAEGLVAELKMTERFIQLFEAEGITGREVASMYFEVAKLNVKLGRRDEAIQCAEKGLELDEYCIGSDHPTYEDGVEFIKALKSKN